MTKRATIDPETTTVHEAMGLIPGAKEVFERFGLDTCCGGGVPLATAAERQGAELEDVLEALERARGTS